MKEYYEDDRVVVPEYIRKMTSAERQAAIAKLEAEARKEKMKRRQKKVAAV